MISPAQARVAKNVNHVFSYSILILVAIIIVTPIFALIATSLKLDTETHLWPVKIFPAVFQWMNYVKVFTMTSFITVAARTGLLGMVVTALVSFSSSMIGFAFARYRVKGSSQLFFLVISMMIIPSIVLLIPQFLLYSRLHLTNTYWPWIFGAIAGSPFYIFLFRQYFMNFPKELEDAAEVDGAGPLRIFWQIFIPNAMPVIATVMIFAFSGVWGDYLMPLIYLNDNKTLLAVRMANAFVNPQGITLTTVSMAANVIYIIPLVILFFLAQKHILKGVIMSGLKG
jgi:multiple sugar transport system permease protein